MSFGESIRDFFQGIVNLLTRGRWEVERAEGESQEFDRLMREAPEALDIQAQRVLDDINEGITLFAGLETKARRYRDQAADWQEKARSMVARAKDTAEGSAERQRFEQLARDALEERLKADDMVAILGKEIAVARPQYEAALAAVQQLGFDRETALSQLERLKVSHASTEARRKLMQYREEWTQPGAPGALLVQAQARVQGQVARQAAEEEVAGLGSSLPLPAVPPPVAPQRVEDELQRLLAR